MPELALTISVFVCFRDVDLEHLPSEEWGSDARSVTNSGSPRLLEFFRLKAIGATKEQEGGRVMSDGASGGPANSLKPIYGGWHASSERGMELPFAGNASFPVRSNL